MKGDTTVRAFIKFNKGMLKMPVHWQLWLFLLITANLLIPLFFLARIEAQLVVAAFAAGVMLTTVLTGRYGFTRILGLGHLLWVPLLYFLWTRLEAIPSHDAFGIWIRALMALNALSLVIDGIDVLRYVAGDRAETIKGL